MIGLSEFGTSELFTELMKRAVEAYSVDRPEQITLPMFVAFIDAEFATTEKRRLQ